MDVRRTLRPPPLKFVGSYFTISISLLSGFEDFEVELTKRMDFELKSLTLLEEQFWNLCPTRETLWENYADLKVDTSVEVYFV